ncbi:MAG: GNAT family N-acetyltransferase [Bacteroidia bacterium]|nr:GNAT family N-acetyltransferase [Bacteroidia bacterium]
MNYRIEKVENTEQAKEFLNFPKRLYANDANYIMPLDIDIENVFNPTYNPAFETGECERWILKDGSKILGRIAAFYNKVEKNDSLTAGCGFFECVKDKEAAFNLFDTAKNWLKSKGCTYMDGPINFGDRDSFWGLMVEGFASPSYRENYNFPYYKEFFEAYGFKSEIGQTTSLIDESMFNFERFSKLASRVFNNPAYTFEHFKTSKINKYAEDFVTIYNKAWAFHENFVPMTKEKILIRMREMAPIVVEDLNIFAYNNGVPVGFYLTVIDVNQIFKHVNGKMNWLGKLKFLYYKKHVKRIRGVVFGVVPEFHNLGIEVALIMKFRENMIKRKQYNQNELAWIGDFNPKMLSMFESMGAQPVKRHITYRYLFQ